MWSFSSFVMIGAVGAACLAGVASPAAAAHHATERDAATLTARIIVPTTARGAPRPGARARMRLAGVTTWTGSAQRLMVTGLHTDGRGHEWVRVQLPVRPNQSSGWVRADRLRLSRTAIRFEVHLRSRRLEIWRGARLLHRYAAGVGRPATPTPVGRFAIQDPVPTVPSWRNVYGSWTLTLTAHSAALRTFMGGDALVAIHGPGAGRAGKVGVPSSHGCVILAEPALRVAARYAEPGTPVVIDRR